MQFPQKCDVDRRSGGAGRERTKQCRQGGPFVVRGAAADVAVAVGGELERIGPPVAAVSRLDVEVVVGRDRGPAELLGQSGVDQRLTGGLDQVGPGAKLLAQGARGFGAAVLRSVVEVVVTPSR